MYLGLYYIHALKATLNAFKGLTQTDIVLLQHLSSFTAGVQYTALYHYLCEGHGKISKMVYHSAINNLEQKGFVTRQCISKERYFTITTQGRKLLHSFNWHLESTVQAKVRKYRILSPID